MDVRTLIPPLLGSVLIVHGCVGKARKATDAGDLPACSEGFIEDEGVCVPEACGAGTWGDLPVDVATVYVDAAATDDGDGTEAAPLRDVQAALDLAGSRGGGLVAVAAGTYSETLLLTSDHAGVHLAGRCPGLVTLDASAEGDDTPGIEIAAASSSVEVSGVKAWGSRQAGVVITSGQLTLRDTEVGESEYLGVVAVRSGWSTTTLRIESSEIVRCRSAGLLTYGAGVTVELSQVEIRDTKSDASIGAAVGINAYEGVTLRVEDSLVEGSEGVGVDALDEGTTVSLVRSKVKGTVPGESGRGGTGVEVVRGARLTAESCAVVDGWTYGVAAMHEGTEVVLRDTTVEGVLPNLDGDFGDGIWASEGATLQVEDCRVSGSTGNGVSATDAGTALAMVRSTVRDILPAAEAGGYGVYGADGASLSLDSCVIEGSNQFGVILGRQGTRAEIVNTIVRDSITDDSGVGGGIGVTEGAWLALEGSLIANCAGIACTSEGEGTRVVLSHCDIVDTWRGSSDGFGYGLLAEDGGSLRAVGCLVEGATAVAVAVTDPDSSASLIGTTIRDTRTYDGAGRGLEIVDGARLAMESCEVVGNTYVGVIAAGASTEVVMLDTVVADTRIRDEGVLMGGYGVCFAYGSSLFAQGCEITCSQSMGVVATHAGTMVALEGCSITETAPDSGGGMGYGVGVGAGARLVAEGCLFDGNSSNGLVASGDGTSVVLRDSTFSHTQLNGEYVAGEGFTAQDSAMIEATGLLIDSNAGPGVIVNGRRSSFSCADCTITDNQFAGAVAVDGGSLFLEDAMIAGTSRSANLGGGVGIYAEPWMGGHAPSVSLVSSTIRDNPVAGVQLWGEGSYYLADSEIRGGEGVLHGSTQRCGDVVWAGEGVTAWTDGSGLAVERSTLQDGLGAGLFLDGASATLLEASFANNAVDIVAQGSGCEEPPPGQECAPAGLVECCPTWDYPTCQDRFELRMAVVELEDARDVAPNTWPMPFDIDLRLSHEAESMPQEQRPLESQPGSPQASLALRWPRAPEVPSTH